MLKGSKHTPEMIEHFRRVHKGRTPWNKGKTGETVAWNKGLKGFMKGRKFSSEHKQRIADALKGNKNGLGHKKTKTVRRRISESRLLRKERQGYLNSPTVRDKMSLAKQGDKSRFWLGGKSFEPYPPDFNNRLKKMIRSRDQHRCRGCFKKEHGRKHSVHHIDYKKNNCSPKNLISLCGSCHQKTNVMKSRREWTRFYKEKVQRL
ncbi:hypothetical protein A2635_03965 [Candidatus Peribacteria bacterium RIFCSPHIGHO2_01_FULL_51_9]|nr:MAG: hypothetical protein A2635_03965 [Candidatus Peribacteria bacterium RIFCSPHIGHO2_01_FULL_51_9]